MGSGMQRPRLWRILCRKEWTRSGDGGFAPPLGPVSFRRWSKGRIRIPGILRDETGPGWRNIRRLLRKKGVPYLLQTGSGFQTLRRPGTLASTVRYSGRNRGRRSFF